MFEQNRVYHYSKSWLGTVLPFSENGLCNSSKEIQCMWLPAMRGTWQCEDGREEGDVSTQPIALFFVPFCHQPNLPLTSGTG